MPKFRPLRGGSIKPSAWRALHKTKNFKFCWVYFHKSKKLRICNLSHQKLPIFLPKNAYFWPKITIFCYKKTIFNALLNFSDCEPFVLQAEIGLSGKALSLLQSIAETHEICARVILSKIFYWLGMLINGMFYTFKN